MNYTANSILKKKIETSIERYKAFEPEDGYYLAFSGGKDSVVIKALADMAGVKYDAHYRIATVDPPELVQFIKEKHPDVSRDYPRYSDGQIVTMWNLIPKKLMPPTRLVRYCCEFLKEDGGDGRFTVTGVRWAESTNRKENQGLVLLKDAAKSKKTYKAFSNNTNFRGTQRGGIVLVNDNEDSRRMVESCFRRHKTTLNPIIEWTDEEVWEAIRGLTIPYCDLYNCGFHRLGCIGCPMAGRKIREREFYYWPSYRAMYLNAFAKMLLERIKKGKTTTKWQTALDVFRWWMEYDELPGQIDLFEEEG